MPKDSKKTSVQKGYSNNAGIDYNQLIGTTTTTTSNTNLTFTGILPGDNMTITDVTTTGGYVNFGRTTNNNNIISNDNYNGNFNIGSSWTSNPIVLSEKESLYLQQKSSNILVVASSNLAISWNDELNEWDLFNITEFNEELNDYKEIEKEVIEEDNNYGIVSGTTSVNYVNTITLGSLNSFQTSESKLIKSLSQFDGNLFIDLDKKEIHKYSESEEKWIRKEYGKFTLKSYRKSKLSETFKKIKSNKSLLVERMRPFDFAYVPNYKSGRYTVGGSRNVVLGGNDFNIINGTNNLIYNYPNELVTTTTTAANITL